MQLGEYVFPLERAWVCNSCRLRVADCKTREDDVRHMATGLTMIQDALVDLPERFKLHGVGAPSFDPSCPNIRRGRSHDFFSNFM